MPELTAWATRAFTLLEALLAAVLLAMVVTAITMPFTAAAHNAQVDARRTLAVALAQEMLEEILTKPFDDPQGDSTPGPEPGEDGRAAFDNVDDYHGYQELAGRVADFTGEVIRGASADRLSRQVSCEYVYVQGQPLDQDPTFVRVKVTVRYRDQPVVTLTRLVYAMR